MELWFIISIVVLICLIIYCILGIYNHKNIFYHIKKNIRKESYEGEYKYIPRKFFLTTKDRNNIHPKFIKNISYLKNLNPTWDYIIYDNKDIVEYIKTHYGNDMLDIYNKINPEYGPARADLFRYLLIYKEGGVYFDIKSSMKYPLDNFLKEDDECILSHWPCKTQRGETKSEFGEFQQWFIISRAKHPFLKAVIDKVIDNINNYSMNKEGVGKLAVLRTTGPIAYTKAIIPILFDYNHRLFQNNEHIGFIFDITDNMFTNHGKIFGKTHYSNLKSPVII